MKILPQKNEVDAALAVLADFDAYPDDRAMAKDLVKAVFLELAKRETWCVAENDGWPFQFYWPFLYEGDAHKFNERYPALDTAKRYVLPMRSSLTELERVEKRTQEAKDRMKGINWPKGPGPTTQGEDHG